MNHFGLIMAVWLAGAVALPAATIPVINHSFEQPELGTEGQDVLSDVPGWKATGKSGVFANIGKYGKQIPNAEGNQLAFLNGTAAGELTQDVSPAVRPNTVYTLSTAVALREDTPLMASGVYWGDVR